MNAQTYCLRRRLTDSLLIIALCLAGASVARASDDCQKRINKADHKLHEAIEHHGWRSSQSEHGRHELAEARSYCWDHSHHWWDADGNRWRSERDWDDHDHDFDHNHH
jgi:hypothetical protein